MYFFGNKLLLLKRKKFSCYISVRNISSSRSYLKRNSKDENKKITILHSFLYGCANDLLAVRAKHKLKINGNKLLG